MSAAQETVHRAIADLLSRRDGDGVAVAITDDTRIYDELEMDSLEVAELSVLLEDEFGKDPYSEGLVPQTVGELVGFFD
ncbi:MAG TPA: phosphopantetheine-binding protein [Mycobacteriales bacterium]|nr:phosphopantetheine-binding protein [Mycobacteriales bacterium]